MAPPDGIPPPTDPWERDPLLGALPSPNASPGSLPKRRYRRGEVYGMTIAMPSFSTAKKAHGKAFIAEGTFSFIVFFSEASSAVVVVVMLEAKREGTKRPHVMGVLVEADA